MERTGEIEGKKMDEELKAELIRLAEEDQELLQEVKEAGELEDDRYHPRLKKIHRRNGERAKEIIDQWGWPGKSLVGKEGTEAMWLIVQHAVGDRAFMKFCVPLLEEAVGKGEVEGWQLAFLRDRTLVQEGKAQIYGTQHELNEKGELVPSEIEDPGGVDARRLALGMETLCERTLLLRRDRERVVKKRKEREDRVSLDRGEKG